MAGISTSQLEETVSFMVKTSQTQSHSSAIKKPSWWPNNFAFCYPIKRRPEHNVLHWRSHLQGIVHKFNKFHNSQRSSLRLKPRKCNNNMQLRQSQRTITANAKLKTIIIPTFPPPVTTCRLRRNSTSSSIGSSSSSSASNASNNNKWRVAENTAVLKQLALHPLNSASKSPVLKSPIVHNYVNSCNSPIPDNIPINVSPCKDNYLNYFGLVEKSDIKNSDIINVNHNLSTKPHKKYYKHNILLCPQIPFSSDIGLKIIKESSEIPQETFERRLERNERFINQKTNSCATNLPEEYKSSYTNKNSEDENSHFYIFPTKKYHSPNKLTPRSRYLLQKYCHPCTVRLENLEIKSTAKNKTKNKKGATKNLLYFKQKENTPVESSKKYLQDFNHSHAISNQNLRLKPPAVNNINSSIVLKPINHLLNQKQMHNSNNTKNRVEKQKVSVYFPRRCSTRLKIVKTNDSLTIL